jgi:hypothetical protein
MHKLSVGLASLRMYRIFRMSFDTEVTLKRSKVKM